MKQQPLKGALSDKHRGRMVYKSIDVIQKALQAEYWGTNQAGKKAAGRLLGTLIEIITFYLLESWRMHDCIAIETRLPEYGNPEITHNVEYTLHPVKRRYAISVDTTPQTLTSKKTIKLLIEESKKDGSEIDVSQYDLRSSNLLTGSGVLRNACVLAVTITGQSQFVCTDLSIDAVKKTCILGISEQYTQPFALFECKRVGVEEGMTKGPQTIEKAKQGAYVAKSVSSLHKIRAEDGSIKGVMFKSDGSSQVGSYSDMLKNILDSNDRASLRKFVLTVGVVSNHGNWFSAGNQNKELKVLAQSYDWLLFLTDDGLAQFVEDLILVRNKKYPAINKAFLASYGLEKGVNQFTKVSMSREAHLELIAYFKENKEKINSWFNVITPNTGSLNILQNQLTTLRNKTWGDIHDSR